MRLLCTSVLLSACTLGPAAAFAGNVNVILLGGQSNMDGRADSSSLPDQLKQGQADVGLFHSAGGSLQANTLVNLAPGSGTDFGPEVTFGRTLADRYPDESFVLIKHAISGTNIHTDWDPSTGDEYATFTSTVAAGLQAIADAGDTPTIIGMAWLQGENDVARGRTQEQYVTDLTGFIDSIRTDFAGGSELPFVIGRLSDNQYVGTRNAAGRERIQAAQDQVAGAVTNVDIFNTDALTTFDNLHYDTAGQQQMGVLFGNAFDVASSEVVTTARFDFGNAGDSDAYQKAGWTQVELPNTHGGAVTSSVGAQTGWTITLTPPGTGNIGGRNRTLDATAGPLFTLEDVYTDFITGIETLSINNLDPDKTYNVQIIMFDDDTDDSRTQTVFNTTDGGKVELGVSDGPGIGDTGVLDSDLVYSAFGVGLSPDATGAIVFEFVNSSTDDRSLVNGVIITEAAAEPAPEPSSLTALSLGALALLLRR